MSKKSKKIVLVFPAAPIPFGNADSRWFYVLLKGLIGRGYNCQAYVVCQNTDERAKAEGLFRGFSGLHLYDVKPRSGLLSKLATLKQPYSYIFSDQMKIDLQKELAAGFDVLHLEQLWTGWLGLHYRKKAMINIHYLQNLDQTFSGPGLQNCLRRMHSNWATNRLIKSYSNIVCLTDRLTQAAKSINPQAEVQTIPLALNTADYPYEELSVGKEVPIVTLIGNFNWSPTYTAARRLLDRLWPKIKQSVPQARLHLVGRSANRFAANAEADSSLKLFDNVPDILPYFQNATVLVYAPPHGSGIKVKVTEAFAMGLAVVTNANGVEGLPVENGVHAAICESDEELIRQTVALLQSPEQALEMKRNARSLIESHCAEEAVLAQIEKVYNKICQNC